MSTLKLDTLSNKAGTASVPSDTIVSGTAKAWVNFDGTGTVAIRRAFNVSSITDNGAGAYTVNFTTAMADANYASSVYGTVGTASHSSLWANQYSPTTSTLSFAVENQNATSTDTAYVSVAIFS